jgi:periplasmic protein TonB
VFKASRQERLLRRHRAPGLPMPAPIDALPEVYSASEIALVAGVDVRDVLQWGAAHNVCSLSGGFYATPQAVRLVRQLLSTINVEPNRRELFEAGRGARSGRALPIVLTTSAHVCLLAVLVLISTAAGEPRAVTSTATMATQLVFLATPGSGGGGGGGGGKETTPPSAAERKGVSRWRSPMPVRPRPEKIDRAAIKASPARPDPAVVAPVVPSEADARDTPGEPIDSPRQSESRGPGADREAGAGLGGGIGSGAGPGLGDGNAGGTGGGPYHPGSGINPPSLIREVKPDYAEEGRRRGIEGDVDLEIVVRSDGSVGEVKLLRGLGAGLDERAIDAVGQWRFSPATRQGIPVDVVVQVSVEFRLR